MSASAPCLTKSTFDRSLPSCQRCSGPAQDGRRWSVFPATNVAQTTAPVAPSTSEKTPRNLVLVGEMFWHRALDDATPNALMKRPKSQSHLPPETCASWQTQFLKSMYIHATEEILGFMESRWVDRVREHPRLDPRMFEPDELRVIPTYFGESTLIDFVVEINGWNTIATYQAQGNSCRDGRTIVGTGSKSSSCSDQPKRKHWTS